MMLSGEEEGYGEREAGGEEIVDGGSREGRSLAERLPVRREEAHRRREDQRDTVVSRSKECHQRMSHSGGGRWCK